MDQEIQNALEAISNLIYLIRQTLEDPKAALTFVGLTDQQVKLLAAYLDEHNPHFDS